jgi:hypothetical protein
MIPPTTPDVIRGLELLKEIAGADELNELRDITRRVIAGLPPDAIETAVVALDEVQILDDVVQESFGFKRLTPEERNPNRQIVY